MPERTRGTAETNSKKRVAFAYSGNMAYPPVIHNIKAYYISAEMVKRGVAVDWVKVGGQEKNWGRNGIRFSVLRAPRGARLKEGLSILRLTLYCIVRRIDLVYFDEWLFFRKKVLSRLACQMVLQLLRVKVVLDQRDPFVDFEIAAGELKVGTKSHNRLAFLNSLILRQADLIILPSVAYASLYESDGIPKGRAFGTFRGIDPRLFNPRVQPDPIRTKLGLDGSFVIGWFGLMHPFRMIKEIIVPLIENLSKELPRAHVLIGGEGPQLAEFEKLLQGESNGSFTLLGKVPYPELPGHIAACDVTICPVNTKFRLARYSNWLKIGESISVGTPIIASRTEITAFDWPGEKGVIWVDSDYKSFLKALRVVQGAPGRYREEARQQAERFDSFSIDQTIPKIVDRVLALIGAD